MHKIFISYSSNDTDIATCACENLEKNGIKCWIAPRDEIGGKDYPSLIIDAINDCEIFLLISSSSIMNSEHVLSEVSNAFDSKKIILPFKIDISQYNKNYQYYLSRKHWIDAFPEPQRKINELVETVLYLLANKNISHNTKDDNGLIAIAEKNKIKFMNETREKRYSSCLSLENEFVDEYHRYNKIKRIDVLNSKTANYSSYRWIEITNVSNTPTNFILHKECGENKINFSKMRVKAKLNDINGEQLIVEPLIEIQPNFAQAFKITFNEPLFPNKTIKIFYRLDWPGELSSYFDGELSQSISLTRYLCGTGELTFGILDCSKIYDLQLKKLNSDYFEESCPISPITFSANDIPDFANMPDKNLFGSYFKIENTNSDKLYRIIYKSILDDDDLF